MFERLIKFLKSQWDNYLVKKEIKDEFSSSFYVNNNLALNEAKINPLKHYIKFGWKEGKDPNEYFSTTYYLKSNPEVKASGINPFFHYLKYGKKEFRKPNELYYLHNLSAIDSNPDKNNLIFSNIIAVKESKLFDEEYYLNHSPDIKARNIDPTYHYCTYGWKEDRAISTEIDCDFYSRMFPEFNAQAIDPITNYLTLGKPNGIFRKIDHYLNCSTDPLILFVLNENIEKESVSFINDLINWYSSYSKIPFKIIIKDSPFISEILDQHSDKILYLETFDESNPNAKNKFLKKCGLDVQLIYSIAIPNEETKALLESFKVPIILHSTNINELNENKQRGISHYVLQNSSDYSDSLILKSIKGKYSILNSRYPVFQIVKLIRFVGKIPPLVSVIVPNYNYSNFLTMRLETILNQSFNDIEVIIIDDHSSDNSLEIIKPYLDHPFIYLIQNKKNSNNVISQWRSGVNEAIGKYIWIAEADDISGIEFLKTTLSAFEDPDVKISFSNSYTIDESDQIIGDYESYYSDLDPSHWKNSYSVYGNEEINFGLGVKNSIPNASAVLFNKESLKKALNKNQKRFILCGDWYTYLSILDKNTKIAFSSIKLNYHRKHKNSVTTFSHTNENKQLIISELIQIHQYIISKFNLLPCYINKWENYLSGQLMHLFPNNGVELFDSIYPRNTHLEEIKRNIENNNDKIAVIITHSAELSGAPQIILNIAKRLNEHYGLTCITFCLEDGEYFTEFENCGEAWMIDKFGNIPVINKTISEYIFALNAKPLFALVNTIVASVSIPQLKKSHIPVAYLVHDYTHSINKQQLKYSYELSDVIIYPSAFLLEKNRLDYQFKLERTFILPQGLYKQEFLVERSLASRNDIRKTMGIPLNAIVLLGCGSINPRKGVDIFLNLAFNLLSNFKFDEEIHFVWLGGEIGLQSDNEYRRYLYRDLVNSNLQQYIHFIKDTKDVKQYFDTSDIFVLSSREDPFPTVVQEAIASGLFLTGFEGTGGAIELIKKANGYVFPFQNTMLATERLCFLIKNFSTEIEKTKHAKEIIMSEYNFSKYVDNIMELLIEKLHLHNHSYLIEKLKNEAK
jgi:glycosyltransferase involved in cell wall biosynthesis